MTADEVAGLVRTNLSAFGGYFVGRGFIDNATMMSLAGAGATIIAGVWSVWAKRKAA